MARPVVLGNNGLTVALDENGYVHDFYYPYVGLENLTTARSNPHYIGIWVDGHFSWLHDKNWKNHIDFMDEALIGHSTFVNDTLQLKIILKDFVDPKHDIFARKMVIANNSDKRRDVRVFFHQTFQISAEGRADTAMYVPDGHYVLDYKGRCSILAYAETESGEAFDQWAVGNTGIEGKVGTFKDAEDGELSCSAVEHASVDSTIRCSTVIEAKQIGEVHYWLCVSDSQDSLESLHRKMLGHGFYKRFRAAHQHWSDWLAIAEPKIQKLSPEYNQAVKKSLMLIKVHIDEHGGILASSDSSIYNYGRDYYSYVWPRDGAYAIWPLIKLGYTHEAKTFFDFCCSILHERGYLRHKYQPDRAIGSTWHPLIHGRRTELAIQEDETATVLIMMGEYLKASGDVEYVKSLFDKYIEPTADFMTRYIDDETHLPHASYDLWEEKFLTSTYTTATTYAALLTAAELAKEFGKHDKASIWAEAAESLQNHAKAFYSNDTGAYIKGFLLEEDYTKVDATLDVSSLYGVFMYNYGSENYVHDTADRVEKILLNNSPSGGSPRYEHDNYFVSDPPYMGNPWFVTTLWLSQYFSSVGRIDDAKELIDWSLDHTLHSGALSEQINPTEGSIVGVTPLVWSHAELINAILALHSTT